MRLFRRLLILGVALAVVACSAEKGEESVSGEPTWVEVDADGMFRIAVPPSSVYERGRNWDSNAGKIYGQGFEIFFDYGMYSPVPPEPRSRDLSYSRRRVALPNADAELVSRSFLMNGKEVFEVGMFVSRHPSFGQHNKLSLGGRASSRVEAELIESILRTLVLPD
jgi:hypothetical protein